MKRLAAIAIAAVLGVAAIPAADAATKCCAAGTQGVGGSTTTTKAALFKPKPALPGAVAGTKGNAGSVGPTRG